MSRLGRNYLQVGMYTEMIFPQKGVRFIAINDGVDSAQGDNDFAPLRNIFKGMDLRGKVMNAAFLVCGASALASHLGFTVAVERSLIFPLLITKLTGGLMGAALALLLTGQSAGNSPVS